MEKKQKINVLINLSELDSVVRNLSFPSFGYQSIIFDINKLDENNYNLDFSNTHNCEISKDLNDKSFTIFEADYLDYADDFYNFVKSELKVLDDDFEFDMNHPLFLDYDDTADYDDIYNQCADKLINMFDDINSSINSNDEYKLDFNIV